MYRVWGFQNSPKPSKTVENVSRFVFKGVVGPTTASVGLAGPLGATMCRTPSLNKNGFVPHTVHAVETIKSRAQRKPTKHFKKPPSEVQKPIFNLVLVKRMSKLLKRKKKTNHKEVFLFTEVGNIKQLSRNSFFPNCHKFKLLVKKKF